MASVYTNDLRLEEIGSGEQSGSWGDTTNTNLELIAEAFSFGTEAITTNANTHTTTIADGASDPGRSMFLKYTGTLDSACTITIAPNTVSKLWFIENGTSGSQNIIIKQGSGATITIPAGQTKAIYSNGAGSGAAMVDAFASLNVVDLTVEDDLFVTDDLGVGGDIDLEGSIDVNGTANLDIVDIDGAVNMATTALVTGVLTTTAAQVINGGATLATNKKMIFRDAAIHISSSADGQLDLVADTEIQIAATTIDINGAIVASGEIAAVSLDISGAIDVDGVANLDVTDIDGTLNVAGVATAQVSANINQVALTSSSNAVAWDAAAAANAFHVTTENTTLSAPSNPVEGAIINIEIAQGGTPRTFAFNTVFEFAASTAPTITATASKTDILAFRYNGSVWQEIGRVQNMAQT